MKELLVEKYRPKRFHEFVSGENNKFVNYISRTIVSDPFKLPNLMLYGSAGCGKTTLANIIVNELEADYLYIDASFNNGVDIIRGIVNEFSKTKSANPKSPKIVFLDESDRLSHAAQDALKNIIEARNKQCRFIFSCNTIARMTEPLKSRCNVYNMIGSDKGGIRSRLQYIINAEDLDVTPEEVNTLIDRYYPDIRSMIKSLDSVKFLGDVPDVNKNIVAEFKKMINHDVGLYKKVCKMVSDRSLNHRGLIVEMFDSISEEERVVYSDDFAEADYRMAVGSTPEIQMLRFVDTVRITKLCNEQLEEV